MFFDRAQSPPLHCCVERNQKLILVGNAKQTEEGHVVISWFLSVKTLVVGQNVRELAG